MLTQSLLLLYAALAAAVKPLEVKNNFFIDPDSGNRFQLVGVAYQPKGSAGFAPGKFDPLSDKEHCLRDAALMQILGVNAIRVYNLDPNLNHDECASIFNAAGMYMLLDVNAPEESLTSFEPWTSYYDTYLNRTFAIVEAFKNYPNTLAFFSGNEVINDIKTGATVPPYVRAVTRDLKNYVAKHCDRPIPVGYSAADVREVLFDSWNYFQCAENGDENDPSKADIFALNSYSWCGDATYTSSGYDKLVAGFEESSVPVFYSEYGCNTPSPRIFTEVPAIYGSEMTAVFSGGIVYEYTQEENNYGLVKLHSNGSATILNDFYTLRDQYYGLDFGALQGKKMPTTKAPVAPVCSPKLIVNKGFNNNFTLPKLPPNTKEILDGGVKPTPSGKLVDISNWNVKFTVTNPDGTTLEGLAVKPLANDGVNHPGTNTVDGSPTTGDGSEPDEDAAVTMGAPSMVAAAVAAAVVLLGVGL